MISSPIAGSARCYDPVTARFLSPDIVVQDGANTQSYNKYSYCLNNPLKYTDPGGYTWEPIRAFRRNAMLAASQELRMQQRLLSQSGGGVWPEISHMVGPNRLTMYGNNADGGGVCLELSQIACLIKASLGIFSINSIENDAAEVAQQQQHPTEPPCNPYKETNKDQANAYKYGYLIGYNIGLQHDVWEYKAFLIMHDWAQINPNNEGGVMDNMSNVIPWQEGYKAGYIDGLVVYYKAYKIKYGVYPW